MAMTVKVQFSASIKELIEATNSVKGAIDGVVEQAKAASEMLKKFGEFTVAGVGLDELKELIGSMAELGKHTEDMSHMLGVSTASVQEWGYIAKMTGSDADSMATAMERFQMVVTKAQNPTSQQAMALHAFGLSAKELIGLPLDQQMARFADAVSKFADGTNKTAAIGMLNRFLVEMIPTLDQGGQAFLQMRDDAIDVGAVLTGQTIQSLDELDNSLIRDRAAMTGFAGALVGEVAPAITESANAFANLLGDLTALIQTGELWNYLTTDMATHAEILALKVGRIGMAMMALGLGNPIGAWADLHMGQDLIDHLEKSISGDLSSAIAKARNDLKELLAPPRAPKKPSVPTVDVLKSSENSAELAEMNNRIELENKEYQQTVAHLNSEAKTHQITEQQKTEQTIAAINQRMALELRAADSTAEAGMTPQQVQEIENKKTQIIQQAVADRQKAVDQQAEEEANTAKSAADQMAGAFNSQLKNILSHHETFAMGMKNIFSDMIMKMISDMDKMAMEWIAKQAMMAAVKIGLNAVTGGTASLVPGFATGAWELPADTLAAVHKGEMIIPQGPAEEIRSGVGGTSAKLPELPAFSNSSSADNRQVHVNFANNGGGISASDIKGHARTIAQAVVDHWKSNPTTRPRGW